MSEITATGKRARKNGQRRIGQPENSATKNGPVGKKGNTKQLSGRSGNGTLGCRKKWQPWIQIPSLTELVTEKMVTGKTSNRKMGNGPKRRGNGDKAITDVS